jgi:NTE family protein
MPRQDPPPIPLDPPPARGAGGVTLVVGAGGAASAAAVGAQRSLQRAGVRVGGVVGSSSGGAVAAALALGWEAGTTEAVLRRLWVPAVTRGARQRAALRLALPGLARGAAFALSEGGALTERVRRAFGEARFEDARIPLRIVATDLECGERVRLEQGSVADAVRASLSVPLLFPPVPWQGRQLVDGALSDPLPVLEAVGWGSEVVVALGFMSQAPQRAGGALATVLATHVAAVNNLMRLASAYYDLAAPLRILRLEPAPFAVTPMFDGSGTAEAIAAGERAMDDAMPELTRLLA